MPCRTFDDDEIIRDTRKTLDVTTDMLCRTLQFMEQEHPTELEQMPEDILTWWRRHQEMDRQRSMEEAEMARVIKLRQSALAKMTPEERDAFNRFLQ
jgi:hypothetical protein